MIFSTTPISSLDTQRLAERHQREGRPQLSIDLCRDLLRRDPHNPAAMQVLGLCLHRLGRSADALDLLRRSAHGLRSRRTIFG